MKKFLAALLTLALLCGALAVGVMAETQEIETQVEIEAQGEIEAQAETEEELEALGRALLQEAMETLRGDYNFSNLYQGNKRVYYCVIHKDGEYAFPLFEMDKAYLHLRSGMRRVNYFYRTYQKRSSLPSSVFLPLLEPKEVTEDTQIEVWADEKRSTTIFVSLDGIRYRFDHNSYSGIYRLEGIRGDDLEINGLNEANPYWGSSNWNVFSTKYFLRTPVFLNPVWRAIGSLMNAMKPVGNLLLYPFFIIAFLFELPFILLLLPFAIFM